MLDFDRWTWSVKMFQKSELHLVFGVIDINLTHFIDRWCINFCIWFFFWLFWFWLQGFAVFSWRVHALDENSGADISIILISILHSVDACAKVVEIEVLEWKISYFFLKYRKDLVNWHDPKIFLFAVEWELFTIPIYSAKFVMVLGCNNRALILFI